MGKIVIAGRIQISLDDGAKIEAIIYLYALVVYDN